MLAGYMLGSNWETVRSTMASIMVKYNIAIFSLLGLALLLLLLRKWLRRGK
jgi:hypothetical protein